MITIIFSHNENCWKLNLTKDMELNELLENIIQQFPDEPTHLREKTNG